MKWIVPMLAASLPLCAANLLKNAGFEGENHYPWIFWPVNQKLSAERPASGEKCLVVSAHEKQQLVIQRPVGVEGGYAYDIRLKMRSENYRKNVNVTMLFRDRSGKSVGNALAACRIPGGEWSVAEGSVIAPEDAVSAEFNLAVSAGRGTVYVDDVSLEKGKRILGGFGDLAVSQESGKLSFKTPAFLVTLDPGRNYALSRVAAGGSERLRAVYLSDSVTNEYYALHLVRHLTLEERDGSIAFLVEEKWPGIRFVRTIEFYGKAPYFKLSYDVEAVADFSCRRLLLNLIFPPALKLIAWRPGNETRYYKWSRPAWFNLERPDLFRCLTYLDADGRNGFAVIGADETSWRELPGKLLSSAGKSGGFTLELNKWVKTDVRSGDRIAFDLLLGPVADQNEAEKLTRTLCPGFL